MGLYKYLSEIYRKIEKYNINELIRRRLIEWRKEPGVIRVEKPTKLHVARKFGYKAKQGFIVVRVRIRKGALSKPRPSSGRRPKRMGVYGYSPSISARKIAEQRAKRKYSNLNVLGSYYVAEDGKYKWFEVVMVDLNNPVVKADKYIYNEYLKPKNK